MKKEAKKEQRRVEKKQLQQQGFHPDRIKQVMAERRAESKAQKEERKMGEQIVDSKGERRRWYVAMKRNLGRWSTRA